MSTRVWLEAREKEDRQPLLTCHHIKGRLLSGRFDDVRRGIFHSSRVCQVGQDVLRAEHVYFTGKLRKLMKAARR